MTVSPEDFGAIGDGIADDTAAWQGAVDTGLAIECEPGKTYRLDSFVTPTKTVDIDLNGSVVAPYGAHNFLNRDLNPTASTTISSGATEGSLQVVVASASGLAAGGWLSITANNAPTDDVLFYPVCWSKILTISGTAITLDRPLPVTFLGTVSAQFFTTAQILGKCRIVNGVIDGAACTKTSSQGMALRIQGYEDFTMEGVTVRNFTGTINVVQTVNCIRQNITSCLWFDIVNTACCAAFEQSNSIHFSNNNIKCSAFGVNITKAVTCAVVGNTVVGNDRADAAATPPVTNRSIRGIKVSGVVWPQIVGNHASDFESPIRIEAPWGGTITGNTVSFGGGGQYGIALNVSATAVTQGRGVVIANNHVRFCNGTGIGYSGVTPGNIVITGNIVQNTQFVGIYAPTTNSMISGNRIDNWDLGSYGVEGIYPGSGATITGNRFAHSTDTTRTCIRATFASTFRYAIYGNVCETANPMFASGKVLEEQGTGTIASAVTSATVTHNLVRTPTASEISVNLLEDPTSDPGIIWISGISSTQFTVNCRTAPGALNLDFAWRAAIQQPFTV